MTTLAARRSALEETIRDLGPVVVAYSGGVDSSVVMEAAHSVLGAGSLAVTAVSPSLARRELNAARRLAEMRGWRHQTIATHEVGREEYAVNGRDRCYWCKTELFEVLKPIAAARRAAIAVGTNADDLGDHRPGQGAARERDVAAPLVVAGLGKAHVRELARSMGLPVADKPASPCLASRFAYGVRVTPEGLRRIERAEEAIRELGFEVFRVRDHGDLARIEVRRADVERAAGLADHITARLKDLGFTYVALDLQGFRSGALNETLDPPTIRRP